MPLWQLPSNVDDWPVDGLQALEETINIAREAGIRVVASHHKARGRSSFGRSGHDTLVVNAARAEGLESTWTCTPTRPSAAAPGR